MKIIDKENVVEKEEKYLSLDDALAMTGCGKFNYFLIIVSGFVIGAPLIETICVGIVFPFAECDLALTTERKGFMGSAGFAGIIICLSAWGYLADRIGRLIILKYALLIEFVFSIVSVFSSNFWIFIFLRFVAGCFLAPAVGIVYAYVAEFHTAQYRDKAIMYASVVFAIIAILVPVAAYLVINQSWNIFIPVINLHFKPWRLFLILCLIPSGVSAVGLMFLPESPKFLINNKNEEKAVNVLRTMYRWNTGKCKDTLDIQHIKEINNEAKSESTTMWQKLSIIFSAQFIRAILIVCFMQFSIGAVSNGAFTWLLTITNSVVAFSNSHPDSNIAVCDIMNYKAVVNRSEALESHLARNLSQICQASTKLEEESVILDALMEVAYTVGFFIIALLIKSTGKFPILFFLSVGCGVCGIVAVYLPYPLLALSMYLIYLCIGLVTPVINASTVDIFPTDIRATAMSISLVVSRIGAVAGANLCGLLLDNYCE